MLTVEEGADCKGCTGTLGDDGTAEDGVIGSNQAAAQGDKRNEGPCVLGADRWQLYLVAAAIAAAATLQ